MSGIIKVFLLLAVAVCVSRAQFNDAGENCLCKSVRNRIDSKTAIKDIQIYSATVFCNRVEIVVTRSDGLRMCLNPTLERVKKIVTKALKNNSFSFTSQSTTTTQTEAQLS